MTPADPWTRIQQAAGTLAALGTLAVIIFTWLSIQQVDNEHALTREGQVTDRYNAAVGNIGEDSLEVRLGGIYALQRIMEDSPRDQPSIVNVLSTYIRNHAKKPKRATEASGGKEPTSDVQAALTALRGRDPHHDSTAQVDLRGAYLPGANLSGADLVLADLSDADLSGADLSKAKLSYTNLTGANLFGADLSDTSLTGANLSNADLILADLSGTDLSHSNLTGTDLRGADLSAAKR
ncbi:pentapeptide repeat-containing protein [Streptomyces kanasensis]|uniref:pentapeptide repeat-containing protein n=1 Tax=Streptomyces kanasensis TaxID=936756 RepID=UPI0037FE5CED